MDEKTLPDAKPDLSLADDFAAYAPPEAQGPIVKFEPGDKPDPKQLRERRKYFTHEQRIDVVAATFALLGMMAMFVSALTSLAEAYGIVTGRSLGAFWDSVWIWVPVSIGAFGGGACLFAIGIGLSELRGSARIGAMVALGLVLAFFDSISLIPLWISAGPRAETVNVAIASVVITICLLLLIRMFACEKSKVVFS